MSQHDRGTPLATSPVSSIDTDRETATYTVVPRELRSRWLAANSIAFAAGGALGGAVLRAIDEPYFETSIPALQAGFVQGAASGTSSAVFGALIGVAQWIVLRRTLHMRWWIPATVAGWTVMGLLTGFLAGGSVSGIGPDEGPVPPLVATLVGVPVALGLLGLFQWLILRRQADEAIWWPIGNVSGLFLGLGTGFALATSIFARTIPLLSSTDFPSAWALLIVGAIGGPLYAAMTWAVLGLLRPKAGSTGPTTSGT